MKLKKFIISILLVMSVMSMSFNVFAASKINVCNDLQVWDQDALVELVQNIEEIKENNRGISEEELMDSFEKSGLMASKGISDIWNSLTDSEKN